VGDLAESLRQLLGKSDHPIQVIGTRHGEKLFETLLTREEMAGAIDQGEYYRIPPDMRDLNYDKYFVDGEERISETPDYNSHNTDRLDVGATRELLLSLPYIQAMLRGDYNYPEA
jgi:UDP-glucose 4-epimerase